jgi:hypothetical protein
MIKFNINYKNHKFECIAHIDGLYECKKCKCRAYRMTNGRYRLYLNYMPMSKNLTCDEVIIKGIIE